MSQNITTDLITMGDHSLLYLQENLIPINCSVYSLPAGHLTYQNYNETNFSPIDANFLPAYYVTNCSITDLINLVSKSDVSNSTAIDQSPYNVRDNGDTFVVLLFTLCASCVSCWMLTLLLYLCPPHKRKPYLAQLATVFYAVVTTIILNSITAGSSEEYYLDNLDIVRLHDILYRSNVYRVTTTLSQAFTHFAWLQIVIRLTKVKFRWYSTIVGVGLILAYFIICTYYEIANNSHTSIFGSSVKSSLQGWRIVRITIKLILLLWLGLTLLYFTTNMKNPRKVSYSKKLLPLAFFNWFLLVATMVINILTLSVFKNSWLVKMWLELIPFLMEVILITTVWEWVFNIWFIEKRLELMGVLGRRISFDDVLSLHSSDEEATQQNNLAKQHVSRGIEFISSLFTTKAPLVTTYDSTTSGSSQSKVTKTESTDSSNLRVHRSRTLSVNPEEPMLSAENQYGDHEPQLLIYEDPDPEDNYIHRSISAGSYEDEVVDNYDIWGDEDEQSSTAPNQNNNNTNQPPPFEPHPGFNTGDYWPTRKR